MSERPILGGPARPVYVVNPSNPDVGGLGTVGQGEAGNDPWRVTGPLTDTQLRAEPVPISAAALPLPAGAATNATVQAIVDALLARLPELIDGRLPVGVQFPGTQPISAAALPLPAGAATQTTLAAVLAALQAPLAVSGGLTDAQLRAAPPAVGDAMAFHASAAGGRLAFNITTAVISLSGTGEQPLAALVNPADSGEDMVLDLGEFGCSTNATFRRYRNATITPTGAARTPTNTGGGSATSAALMYIGGTSPTYTRSGGVIAKDAFVQAYTTYFTYLRGRSVLRPGQSLSWTIQNPQGGNFTASVYIEYFKRPAEA